MNLHDARKQYFDISIAMVQVHVLFQCCVCHLFPRRLRRSFFFFQLVPRKMSKCEVNITLREVSKKRLLGFFCVYFFFGGGGGGCLLIMSLLIMMSVKPALHRKLYKNSIRIK